MIRVIEQDGWMRVRETVSHRPSFSWIQNFQQGAIIFNMTWTESPDVDVVPGKMAGAPVILGTRLEPETILNDYELGSPVEEIHENFPTVSIATILRLLAFARSHQHVA